MTIHQPLEKTGTPLSLGGLEPGAPARGLTPTGLQPRKMLMRRRIVFAALNIGTYVGLLGWMWSILSAGGWSAIDSAIFACFALAAPWGVMGIWNALIGLWLLHGRRDALQDVAPYAAAGDDEAPVTARVAIVMTVCNEAPERAFRRLEIVRDSLEKTSAPEAYSYFILSDTRDPEIAAAEETAYAALQLRMGPGARLHYRRRNDNVGYKAGNIREFCDRWGDAFDFFVPLDADSLMAGETIERMVRIGQAHPRLGILQSLAVGAPSSSAFARVFQFGMRQGMRPYTMGSAWWTGDCGPFWGHNALVCMDAFREHCHLPSLPEDVFLGGRILSHDQLEAVLMRRAGYEVRVLPVEAGSWEDNPPGVLEFMQRDTRWCQGNMQYVHLLRLPGIEPASRFQLVWAVMMFAGLPAWTAIIALAAFKPLDGEDLSQFPVGSAIAFYLFYLAMFLAPKLAGYIDIALTPGELRRYGGGLRFAAGAFVEILFSFLVAAVVSFQTSVFMIGLAFGKTIGWGGQVRDAHVVRFSDALAKLWPQLLFGLSLYAVAAYTNPSLILWSLPLTFGYVAGIPFAMATASPALGAWTKRNGICAIPEDLAPPPEIAAIAVTVDARPKTSAGWAVAG